MTNKYPKLVLIEWVDSGQPIPSWRLLDDLPAMKAVRCLSVGWLVAEDNDVKMLAPNVGDMGSGGNEQASGFIRIPTRAVVRQVDLIESCE